MVDQIETAATQRSTVSSDERSGRNDGPIATLRTAERYDRVRIVPLDVTLRVLNQIGDFGGEGVRAAGDDTTYLLVAESDPELPDVRIERWNGTTFRPVLRTSRVRVSGDGDDRVFRVPAGVRVDRGHRTGGGRARFQPDGGRSAVETARDLSAGARVRVVGEEIDSVLATVDHVDDEPPVASELFKDARHVFLDAGKQRYRVLTYQTATSDDAIHLATPDAGIDGTWQRSGVCTRLERVGRAEL